MTVSIQDKVTLVTGANRGIGKAIVESLIHHGAKKVYLAVRDPESTAALASEFGDKVVTLKVDVSNAESITNLANQAQDVQILVNNAGVLEVADPLADNVEKALRHELEVNLFGLVRMANAFTPIIERNGHGALVQLNSVASIKNFLELSSYSASKAAAYSITQGLREVLSAKGIHVVSVHPGPIATDMAAQAGVTEGESTTTVSEGIISALQNGDFHLFPDAIAKDFESAYRGYANALITPSEVI